MKFGPVLTNNKWLQLPEQLVATYNLWDCYNTSRLIAKTTNLLLASGNETFFRTEFWPLVPVVGAMQARGVGELDREARNKYRAQLRSEIGQLEKQILVGTTSTYTDKLFNSPKQLAELLYNEWSLPKPPLGRGRTTPSTDLQALAWTLTHFRKRDEPHREQLHKLFHRSRLQTILERYLVVEGDEDGRVRPTIKITGTETGRFAYAGGPGEAIQQWPHEARHLIRAKPGHVFVARDYSQLEARILAVLSQDKLSLDAFACGRDIHTQNCRDLFGLSEAEFAARNHTQQTALRNFAKCLSPTAWVEMHDGSQREAQTLKPGEWTSQGQVIASQSVGPARMLEVWTSAGHKALVTDNHPVMTQRGWVAAKDLVAEKAGGGKRTRADRVSLLIRPSNPEQNYPDEFYRVLGYLIGDGGTTAGITFTNIDEPIVAELVRCVDYLGGSVRKIDYKSYQISGLGWVCDTWGLRGVKSIHKSIPECVWRSSYRQREIFLSALWECDGTTNKHTTSLGSSSPALAKGVHLMLNQMGIESTLYHTKTNSWVCRASARGRARIHFWPFVCERKRPSQPTRARKFVPQITKVVDMGISEAWGLQIDSGQHITDGLLTHNTFLYGLSYGAKSDSLKMKLFCPCTTCAPKAPPQVNLDRAAIKAAAARWEQAHPAIMDFRSHLVESVYGYGQDRTWTSPFGWRRRLWEPQDQGERSLLNLPMQHCASVIINRAMRKLHEHGVPLVLQMHDELVAEVPTDEAERTLELMRVVMEASVPELDNTVFPTSGATGQTWADLK